VRACGNVDQSKPIIVTPTYLDVEPEPLDCDKPQSFENNFVHHMAIGETIVGTLWASFAGICIEKLLDELLKVNFISIINSFNLLLYLEWNQSKKIYVKRISRCITTTNKSNIIINNK